jgi:hypothetical protein
MTLTATDISFPGSGAINNAEGALWMRYMTLAFSGSYVTGGDAFNPLVGWPGAAPSQVITVQVDGGAGYDFEFQKPSGGLKVFSSAGTELAAGAYPAALTGDTNTVVKVTAK